MMTERTRKEIEKLAKEYKGKAYSWDNWEWIINNKSAICFDTFCKYVTFEEEISYEEYTLEEIVEMLNNCAGEDCYGSHWKYIVKDGKPCEEIVRYRWKAL